MNLSMRRLGIGLGALVEAGLIVWLLGGFLPAGILAVPLTVALGALVYRDITRRDSRPSRPTSTARPSQRD